MRVDTHKTNTDRPKYSQKETHTHIHTYTNTFYKSIFKYLLNSLYSDRC